MNPETLRGKRILAVYFSQSGQLREVLDNLLAPLDEAHCAKQHFRGE